MARAGDYNNPILHKGSVTMKKFNKALSLVMAIVLVLSLVASALVVIFS